VAVKAVRRGEPVRKYGQVIGFAAGDILPGDHVHTHNLRMGDFSRDHAIGQNAAPIVYHSQEERAGFQGITRPDGKVGTRNYVGILTSVNCAAGVARFIADRIDKNTLDRYPNVDGIVALGHGTGCGMVGQGEALDLLQRTIAGYARHPNFAGVVLVGLGCEVNQIDCLMEASGLREGPSLRVVGIQQAGGTAEAVRRGVEAVKEMLSSANQVMRVPVSAEHLVVGLECGGSDAFSGLSANPALGYAVDLIVQNGATAILSETPEIYGAEHLLTRRAVRREVGEKLIARIRWWEDYTRRLGGEINNNPTPGNKAGGLTTILEKSLGASAKGGTTPLVDVYRYAEPVKAKGLVFMDTPGHDTVSVTGMIAGGANVICFTTGRGTVCGFKPAPCLKLATNTGLYERMRDDMDLNCGPILEGKASLEEMGRRIFETILATASGRKTRSEAHGFGGEEFVPWNLGPVL
jgi:altronate hydrolase